MHRLKLPLILCIALLSVLNNTAHADCTNPAGVAGEMLFNDNYKVMQYCNGTDWHAMGTSSFGGGGSVSDPWAAQPIGVPIPLFDNIAGVEPPPTDKSYRYIKLTASDAYNTGVLTSQSQSGSAPNITATAVVTLADSPLNGATVPLINTDRRFVRAGSAGTKQQSQNLSHSHSVTSLGSGGYNFSSYNGSLNGTLSGLTTSASGGDESRPSNIGATYYMRIK